MTETRWQYRVTYRRTSWARTTSNKSRTFSRRDDAQRLVARLLDPGVRDLTPLALLRVDRRPVGGWEADRSVPVPRALLDR